MGISQQRPALSGKFWPALIRNASGNQTFCQIYGQDGFSQGTKGMWHSDQWSRRSKDMANHKRMELTSKIRYLQLNRFNITSDETFYKAQCLPVIGTVLDKRGCSTGSRGDPCNRNHSAQLGVHPTCARGNGKKAGIVIPPFPLPIQCSITNAWEYLSSVNLSLLAKTVSKPKQTNKQDPMGPGEQPQFGWTVNFISQK